MKSAIIICGGIFLTAILFTSCSSSSPESAAKEIRKLNCENGKLEMKTYDKASSKEEIESAKQKIKDNLKRIDEMALEYLGSDQKEKYLKALGEANLQPCP